MDRGELSDSYVSMESGLSLDPYSVPQRHTFYDSDSDDSVEDDELVFVLRFSSESPVEVTAGSYRLLRKVRLLLVCVSTTASTLARSYLDLKTDATLFKIITNSASKAIKGRCFSSRESTENGTSSGQEETISDVYAATGTGGIAVCFQRHNVNREYCNAWSEKLLNLIDPDMVLVLCTLFMHKLISGDHLGDASSALFSLQTRSWSGEPLAAFLPPPNIIKGEAAAVLSQCQHRGIPASLAVLYHSPALTELERVQAMQSVLFHPAISGLLHLKSTAEAEKEVKKHSSPPRHDWDTLYT